MVNIALDKRTREELKEICEREGVRHLPYARKEQLIEAIKNHRKGVRKHEQRQTADNA